MSKEKLLESGIVGGEGHSGSSDSPATIFSGLEKDLSRVVDVSEVYSPPRMTTQAIKMGLKAGSALDLTIYDQDRSRARFVAEDLKCITVRPMCGPFGQLQNRNYRKMRVEDVEKKPRAGMMHLMFAMELCKWQSKRNKFFVFEHPQTATSWKLQVIREVLKFENIVLVDFDFCYYGMTAENATGKHLVKKIITIMTNSSKIAHRFRRAQCARGHEHTHLINVRAIVCEVYLDKFCQDVCLGIKEELSHKAAEKRVNDKVLGALINQELSNIDKSPHDDTAEYEWL